jgi:preprotein translocase SecE subunit
MRKGPKAFWIGVVRELKKVDWPPPKEVNRLTGVVLAVCGLVVAALWAISQVIALFVNIVQGKV